MVTRKAFHHAANSPQAMHLVLRARARAADSLAAAPSSYAAAAPVALKSALPRSAVAHLGACPALRPASPSAGFARNLDWEVMATSPSPVPSVSLRLADTDATRAMWPHHFEVIYTVTLANDRYAPGSGSAPIARERAAEPGANGRRAVRSRAPRPPELTRVLGPRRRPRPSPAPPCHLAACRPRSR